MSLKRGPLFHDADFAAEPGRLSREVVCALLAALFSHYLMHYHLAVAVQLPFADLEDLLALSAPRPFCYRCLSPWVLKAGTSLGLSPKSATAWLEWGSFVLLYYLFRAYLGKFVSSARAAYAALSVYFVVPFVFIIPQPYTVWFPWDIPSVAFFTALLLLRQRPGWLWYPVFLLATLNRETTLFLLPLLALSAWREGFAKRAVWHLVATSAIWVAAKGALAILFRAQSGPTWLEWNHYDGTTTHWQENLSRFGEPTLWPYLLSALGFLWVLAWHLRRSVPSVVGDTLVIVPFYVLGVLLFGNVVEHRVYGDLIPVVLAPLWVWGLGSRDAGRASAPGTSGSNSLGPTL